MRDSAEEATSRDLVEDDVNRIKTLLLNKIEPTLSHYACMVDLFGRAGLLQEAHEFIEKMPIVPDVVTWGSLLSACRVHKNVDLGKVAAERLLLTEPENSGAYSALANLYSACGKWEEAAKIRKSMKDGRVKKEQGFSWIEVTQRHKFAVTEFAVKITHSSYEISLLSLSVSGSVSSLDQAAVKKKRYG